MLEKNKELLSEIPFRHYLDLALIYCVAVDNDGLHGTVTIHNSHLEAWGLDEEELYLEALKNTPENYKPALNSLKSVVGAVFGLEGAESGEALRDDFESLYVASNETSCNGAAVILYPGFLKVISETVGSDLYLLPSSIHEFILVPACSNVSPDDLSDMVKNVNFTVVSPEEILSDSVYFYNRSTDKVSICA